MYRSVVRTSQRRESARQKGVDSTNNQIKSIINWWLCVSRTICAVLPASGKRIHELKKKKSNTNRKLDSTKNIILYIGQNSAVEWETYLSFVRFVSSLYLILQIRCTWMYSVAIVANSLGSLQTHFLTGAIYIVFFSLLPFAYHRTSTWNLQSEIISEPGKRRKQPKS